MKSGGLILGAMFWLAMMVCAPPVLAGDLNPPGPPAPTMKPLDETPGSWHRILPVVERFKLVMGDAAVLDKETGLVWERSPDTTVRNWPDSVVHCFTMQLGGRKGWRLPTVEELASLVDSGPINPALPYGHPFLNVQNYSYWSATTDVSSAGWAWHVHISSSFINTLDKTIAEYAWCVRAGRGIGGL
jgi:hypothetical protein